MSLWTPGGEHTPDPDRQGGAPSDPEGLSPEEQERLEAMQAELANVREQLLAVPASVVVANHGMGLYELAAIHLTAPDPKLSEAVLAIDALAAIVEALAGRLGEAEPTLQSALSQLRAAYLEVKATADRGSGAAPPADAGGSGA